MRFYLLVLAILTACGEPTAPQDVTDMFVRPVRDARPVRVDMRPINDAALPNDMGLPTGSRDESRSTFFPGEYVPYGTCPDVIEYGGQTTQVNPMPPNGGTLRVTSYPAAYDGGLAALLQAVPAVTRGEDPPTQSVEQAVTAVTVVATRSAHEVSPGLSQAQGRFWVADGQATLEVYLDLTPDALPGFPIHVGQVISFNATKVGRYGDRAQVRSGRDWQLIESAPAVGLAPGPNAEVAVFEPSGEMTEEHINRMVRVTGILEGEADRCGSGHLCWRLNYGAAETTFRTRDDDLVAGTCVTFVGPASSFNGNVQLEPFNPLWARRYQRGSELGEPCEVDEDCTTAMCVVRDNIGTCGVACESADECPQGSECSEFGVCLPRMGSDCPDSVTFVGQLQGLDAEVPNGGTARLEPFPRTYDSGLEALVAQLPAITPDGDPPARFVDLPIERATVIATRPFTDTDVPESQGRFWVADGRATVEVFLDLGQLGGTPPFPVSVGQVISFRATRIGRYQTKPQISAALDFAEHTDVAPFDDGLAGPNAEIHLWEPDRVLDRSDANKLIRVTGQLDGRGNTCGSGNRCWELAYGFGDPLILRTSHPLAEFGTCVTYVGPLGVFRGNLQLDSINLDWLKVYE